MFCQFILNICRHSFQFICPQIHLISMQSMARSLYNIPASFDKLLLFSCKHAPPDQFWRLSRCIWRKTMKGTLHIVERQHSILLLDVLDDLPPVLMIVEFRTQHLIAQRKPLCVLTYLIYKVQFTLADIITIVDKACQSALPKRKPLIVALQHGSELRMSYLFIKVHPYRILRIVEEYRRGLFAFDDGLTIPLYSLNTIRPSVSRKKILFSHITLCLIPDALELRTFDVHREILVSYGQ